MSYLQPHTLGSVIRSAFSLYLRHLPTLFLICAVPLLTVQLLHLALVPPTEFELVAAADESGALAGALFGFLEYVAGALATFPVTVAISEICLGIKPSFARSYQRAFSHPGRLVGTYLLAVLVLLGGLLLFVIPGLVFAIWYMFIAPVLVLEGIGGVAALRRSRQLGKGYYWRNAGVYVVTLLIFFALAFLFGVVLGILAVLFDRYSIIALGSFLATDLSAPLIAAVVVLLYYDMRAKKEGYGAAQLAEDLRL